MTSGLDPSNPAATRRQIYARAAVARADLSQLMRLGEALAAPEYAQLLADVAVDLLVHQVDPPKYVTQADADWLIAEIGASKLVYAGEVKLLSDVLEYSVSAPPSLAAFFVAEIEKAIVSGREGHPAGAVSAEDIANLRKGVFATVEGDALHVTRDSAEALFRIAHATAGAANDAEFDDFFAKAIGNYLMGIAFHWTASAAQERDMEHWLDEKPQSFESFLGAMFSGSAGAAGKANSESELEDAMYREENEADAKELASAAAIDAGETDWLMAHLSRPGAFTSAERALLAFLKREAPSMPAPLAERLEEKAA